MSEQIQNMAETPGQRLRFGSSAGAPRFYCNNAMVTATEWDFTMFFGEMLPQIGAEAGDMEIAARAVVVMSPPHAKAFLNALRTTLTQWEEATAKKVALETQ